VRRCPSLIIARTDAQRPPCSPDIDERDQPFVTGERPTWNGLSNGDARAVVHRPGACAYAPYSDLLLDGDVQADLEVPARSGDGYQDVYRTRCSPSTARLVQLARHLDEETIAKFGKELAAMGYRFQFITLAGFTR